MIRSSNSIKSVEGALAKPGVSSSDFDLNPDVILPKDRSLRDAAVLIVLSDLNGIEEVLLTKRASGLKHHPGQIAFPGGKKDASDIDLQDTALREAFEEIGLPATHVEVLGTLPSHETVTSFTVTPYVARLTTQFVPVVEPDEVSEVFSVPLSHVLQTKNYVIEGRRWRGQTRQYYTVPFGPYYIWGATARMLRGLAEQVLT